MGLEHRALRRRAEQDGPRAGDYERRDTLASLSMGVGSLVLPPLIARALQPVTPGRGRYGRALVATAVAAAAVTTAADVVDPPPRADRRPASTRGRRDGDGTRARRRSRATSLPGRPPCVRWRAISASSSVVAVAAGVVAGTTDVGLAHRGPAALGPLRSPPRPRRRRAGHARGDLRVGRHLLLEPPPPAREPLAVGDPRRAPLERALQPLDRPAPARRRGLRGVLALRRPRPWPASGRS